MLLLLLLLLLFPILLCFLFCSSFPSLFLLSSVPSSSFSPVFSLPLASSSVLPFLLSLLLLFLLLCRFPSSLSCFICSPSFLFFFGYLFPLQRFLPLVYASAAPPSSSSFSLPLFVVSLFLIMVLLLSLLLSLHLLLLPFFFFFFFFFSPLLLLLCLPFLLSLLLLLFLFSIFPWFFLLFSLFPLLRFLLFLFGGFLLLSNLQLLLPLRLLRFPRFCSSFSFGSCGTSWFFSSALFSSGSALFRFFLFNFLGLLSVLRSRPPLSRGPSRVLPYIFVLLFSLFLLLRLWGGLAVFPSTVFGLSAEFQVLIRWFVTYRGSAFCCYLFASLLSLSFLVFVLTFLMVLLAFYLLCFCFASIPPLYSVATAVSSVSTIPGSSGSGSLFFFSGSFCCSASLPFSFIALSILCGVFFFSSSGPLGSSGVFRFFGAYLFLSSVSGGDSGFWCCSSVRCGPCFSYYIFSFLGYFSFPSFHWGSTSFRGGSCGYSPFRFPFHPVCSSGLSGYFFVIFCHSSSLYLVPSFVAPDGFRGIRLRPLCFTMGTLRFLLQFRGLCGLNIDACSLSLGIAFRRLRVFTLLLLLFCLLVLVRGGPHGPFSATGSRLVSFHSSGWAFFSLLATRLMPSGGCSLWGVLLQISLRFSLLL